MSKSKMRGDFRKMAKWAIKKMFENNYGEMISVGELQKELRNAWDELCEDGDIVDPNDDSPQPYKCEKP